jgi:hypothetical protein
MKENESCAGPKTISLNFIQSEELLLAIRVSSSERPKNLSGRKLIFCGSTSISPIGT